MPPERLSNFGPSGGEGLSERERERERGGGGGSLFKILGQRQNYTMSRWSLKHCTALITTTTYITNTTKN